MQVNFTADDLCKIQTVLESLIKECGSIEDVDADDMDDMLLSLEMDEEVARAACLTMDHIEQFQAQLQTCYSTAKDEKERDEVRKVAQAFHVPLKEGVLLSGTIQ